MGQIEINTSRFAAAGACALFLMRKISARVGYQGDPLVERIYFDLTRVRNGSNLDTVDAWMRQYSAQLAHLGYRFGYRRIAYNTDGIADWVTAGAGYRGAVLMVAGDKLHPSGSVPDPHYVALAMESTGRGDVLTMVDPWPSLKFRAPPPDTLELAHRYRNYAALVIFQLGWG